MTNPKANKGWRPARPAERANARRAQTDIPAGRTSALREAKAAEPPPGV
jgi:hypothetical protein